MRVVDFRQELESLHFPSANHVATVDVPEMRFLAIDGASDTSPTFLEAADALRALSVEVATILKGSAGRRG